MKSAFLVLITMLFLLSACSTGEKQATPAQKDRAQIEDRYKWDLTPLYADEAAWKTAKDELKSSLGKFDKYKGKLAGSSGTLLACLQDLSATSKELYRLSSYASRLSDIDKRESGPLAMEQEMSQLGTDYSQAVSFIEPEILSIPAAKMKIFFKQRKGLDIYRQYIGNIQRMQAHTRSASEEELIAAAGMMSGSPGQVYSVFANAEMPRATIELSDGKKVTLDAAGYTGSRATSVRADRQKIFEAFFGKLKEFEGTLGTNLYTEVKTHLFYKTARKYQSCLETALDANNIPSSVYTSLIKSTHDNLPTLHRYLNLRKKMLGVDELRYYDMYPPLVEKVDLRYNVEEAEALIKKALAPLGEEYINTLDIAFNNRWIDIYPTPGKRSGAYSTGSEYDVHPYILLNYNGDYDDVSTMAHELGHTMHSYFSNKSQPFINSQYPIFLAEVASTGNENLLINYVLRQIDDPQKKLALLGNWLESFRTTLFRQTMFAEFELKMNELAEQGESLTGEKLSSIYLELLKQYYGHDQGVTVIDDLYGIEWAYIPHFYYNFYVFQYATSYCASTALAEKMLSGEAGMVDKYIKDFLSAGSSDYAIPILKKVGVDMTTTQPFEIAMKRMNAIMDEMEQILAKK